MTMTKLTGAALAVLLAASLTGCAKPEAAKPAVDTAKLAEAVKADAKQLVTDFNAHDAVKSVSHDGPDYVGMFHGMPNVKGAAEDLVVTKQQTADTTSKLAIADESVDVASAGDMAVYRSTYAYVFTDPKTKKLTTEHGNWVLGYKTQPDGSVKLAWSVVSDTPPPAPAGAPAATAK
jgi:ketosteroid isomerase-like protein